MLLAMHVSNTGWMQVGCNTDHYICYCHNRISLSTALFWFLFEGLAGVLYGIYCVVTASDVKVILYSHRLIMHVALYMSFNLPL